MNKLFLNWIESWKHLSNLNWVFFFIWIVELISIDKNCNMIKIEMVKSSNELLHWIHLTQMAIWLKLKWSSFGPKLNHMAPKLCLNDVALKLDLISHMASN
jgi:hypothetical protein